VPTLRRQSYWNLWKRKEILNIKGVWPPECHIWKPPSFLSTRWRRTLMDRSITHCPARPSIPYTPENDQWPLPWTSFLRKNSRPPLLFSNYCFTYTYSHYQTQTHRQKAATIFKNYGFSSQQQRMDPRQRKVPILVTIFNFQYFNYLILNIFRGVQPCQKRALYCRLSSTSFFHLCLRSLR